MTKLMVRPGKKAADLRGLIFEQSRDAILIFDRDMRLADANDAAVKRLQLPENAVGGACREMFRCEHLGMGCIAGKAMVSQKEYISETACLIGADGDLNFVWMTAYALKDGGGTVVGAAEVLRDIKDVHQINSGLLDRAATDPLTGLCTRRVLENTVAVEASRSARHGHTFSMLLLDLDNFKRYNDCHGPTAGDNALRFTADMLNNGTRREDVVIRLIGDAFVIIAPETGRAGALIIADRLRAKIHEISNMAPQLENRFSVSVGVTCSVIGDAADAERLLSAARAALDRARAAGGNRTAFMPCDPETAQNRESA